MIDILASGSRQLFGIWTFRRLVCVYQQYLSIAERFLSPIFLIPWPNVSFNPVFTPTVLGALCGIFRVFFCGVEAGAGVLIAKLAAIGQIGKCAVTVIPHSGYGTLPAGSADWHGDSLTESVFVFAFGFLAWFCLQFPSQDLIYFGDFKTKSTSDSASCRYEKKSVCGCIHNPSPNGAEFTQKAFHIEFALQGACGAGVSRCSCPLPSVCTRSSDQIFPSILSTLWNFYPLFQRSPKEPLWEARHGEGAAGRGFAPRAGQASFSNSSVAPCIESPGNGKGASSASRGSHCGGRLPNRDRQAGGGVLSSPLREHRETSLFGRQPGSRWLGCDAELSGGVSFLWLFWTLIPMLERSPSFDLLPSSLCPDFFAAAIKDRRQLELQPCWYSCGLSATIPSLWHWCARSRPSLCPRFPFVYVEVRNIWLKLSTTGAIQLWPPF